MSNYVAYHVHSELSLLDSCTNFKLYVDRAKELGQSAICFTEHGNVFSWVDKKLYCEKQGLKYIHGIECYLTADDCKMEFTERNPNKNRDNYHTILIAKNYNGVKEINSLIEISSRESHKYYNDRISFDEFFELSDNIIKISACMASPLNNIDESNPIFEKLVKSYDYLEIQPHVNSKDQKEYNQKLLKLSKQYGIPLIAGTDTHSLNKYKAECRKILLKSKRKSYGNEDEFDLTYKSYDELVDMFRVQGALLENDYIEAINNTNAMSDNVEEFKLDMSFKYPKLYDDEENVFWDRIILMYNEKLEKGIIKNNPKYIENIKEEFGVLKKIGMCSFMLFMSELMCWCWDNNIPSSPCRGCFTKDALILTKSGLKTIDKVNIGDMVVSDDNEWHKVINKFKYDINEPMIQFEYAKQGSTKLFNNMCTLDHKILVFKNNKFEYIPASEINIGDILCSPKISNGSKQIIKVDLVDYDTHNYNYDNEYIYEKTRTNKQFKYSKRDIHRTTGLSRNCISGIYNKSSKVKQSTLDKFFSYIPFNTIEDWILYVDNNAYTHRKIKRYIVFDYDFNYLIGCLYGDGNTTRNGIEMAINSKRKYGKNRDIFINVMQNIGVDITEIKSNNRDLIQMYGNSQVIKDFITAYLFKSVRGKDKEFSIALFNQPNELLRGIYDGLIDSDGSMEIQTGGINTYRLSFDNTSLSLITAFKILNSMLGESPLRIDTRFPKNSTWKTSFKLSRSVNSNKLHKTYDLGKYWGLEVTNVNKINTRENRVYDLMVENCHSYTLNNVIVHNSVGGSTIAYITNITDVDPTIWNTVFSRFANEDRIEIGDVDVDFKPEDRERVYKYIIDRFGEEYTSYIMTSGTCVEKGTIDEICRALEIPLNLADKIKSEYASNPDKTKNKYPNVFYYFDGLINTVVSKGVHPAAMIISPVKLSDNYGIYHYDGKRVISINMEEVHEVSLVKYDILGLKNVGVIKDCCELSGIPYPKSHMINWKDSNVWDDISNSNIGIFQFESDYAGDCLRKFQANHINDLSLVNAAIRPSGASYRDKLFAKQVQKNPSDVIDNMLSANYGYLCFQEDTIKFLKDICGLSGSEADNIRRAIGRKQKDRLEKALPKILEGYCSKSSSIREIAEKEAQTFLQIIEDSSDYQFGLNHSTGYSMLGYLCAYMRFYHPLEFCSALLNNAKTEDDIVEATELASIKKITINPIKFRFSKSEYACDKETNSIYKGIGSVKFCNDLMGEALYSLRDKKYDCFIDLLLDLNDKSINSRQLDILIKLDYFSEFYNSKELLRIVEVFELFKQGSAKQISKDKLNGDIEMIVSRYSRETEKKYILNDVIGCLKELEQYIKSFKIEDFSLREKAVTQLEYLGYVDIKTGLPEDTQKLFVLSIEPIKTKDKGSVWAYRLKTCSVGRGKKSEVSILAKKYKEPIKKYDTIYVDKNDITLIEKNGYRNLWMQKYRILD